MNANYTKKIINLGDLLEKIDKTFASIIVTGLQLDSREVVSGDLFLACVGFQVDGRNFIDQAISAGAVAVIAEQDEKWPVNSMRKGVPIIVIENLNSQLSEIAGNYFQHPSKKIPIIAVTGTNGKTSCTQLIMQLLNGMQETCGVIGTLGVGKNGEFDRGTNTTPDALSIQRHLAQWCEEDISMVAMEVSSHGLEQRRVEALQFELALFTNLSRDHLDYHGSMQRYAEIKTELFRQPGLKKAVINCDDELADTLIEVVDEDVDVTTYKISSKNSSTDNVNVWVENIVYHENGVNALLHTPWGDFEIVSPFLGTFNLSNLVGVITCLGALGYPITKVINEIANLKTVVGRMHRITPIASDELSAEQNEKLNCSVSPVDDVTVVVDYAHTPDALQQALLAMRLHSNGQLWCLFGCGGDRDQGKRAQMGEVVERYADHVIVTSDNPRSESASSIIDEILSGVNRPSLVEEDRGKAIEFVIANAEAGDSVLIAGKGDEEYQQIGNQRLPFSDIKQAQLALSKRLSSSITDSYGLCR